MTMVSQNASTRTVSMVLYDDTQSTNTSLASDAASILADSVMTVWRHIPTSTNLKTNANG